MHQPLFGINFELQISCSLYSYSLNLFILTSHIIFVLFIIKLCPVIVLHKIAQLEFFLKWIKCDLITVLNAIVVQVYG